MLKTCPTCGKLHGFNDVCPIRIERDRCRQALYDRTKYERNSKADKFRNTKQWQRKRNEIKDRDLNICRYCFLCRHKITADNISVHHIIPLKKISDCGSRTVTLYHYAEYAMNRRKKVLFPLKFLKTS